MPQIAEIQPLIISTVSRCALGMVQSWTLGSNASSVTQSANNISIMVPFDLTSHMRISHVWWVNGGTCSGTVDVGLYSLDMTLLCSLGSTTAAGTTAVQCTALGTPYLLTPGYYYMAISVSSSTQTFYKLPALQIGVAGWKMLGCGQVASNHPLATGVTLATFVESGTARVPYFGFASEDIS